MNYLLCMGNNIDKVAVPEKTHTLYEKLTNKELLMVKEWEWKREEALEKSINFYWNLKK